MESCGCVKRPNRSDVHLSKEEEAKMEEGARDYFDGIAPKRHAKPQRSEYSKTDTDSLSCCSDVIPEYVEFQRLESDDSQKLAYTNGNQETDEFVETEYYKDLNSIDKQHHTTGSGFIAVEKMTGKPFSLEPDSAIDLHGPVKMESCGCVPRPNRSDVHLTKEEETKIEEAAKDYFDGIAPKRHAKPQRSEYSKTYTDALSSCRSDAIPEYVEFQRLESDDSQKLVYTNGNQETDEFVETEYYKDLNSIDKQHHTTGTGFITVEKLKGKPFSLDADSAIDHHGLLKGNPATNEWIPGDADKVGFVSDKPERSDN